MIVITVKQALFFTLPFFSQWSSFLCPFCRIRSGSKIPVFMHRKGLKFFRGSRVCCPKLHRDFVDPQTIVILSALFMDLYLLTGWVPLARVSFGCTCNTMKPLCAKCGRELNLSEYTLVYAVRACCCKSALFRTLLLRWPDSLHSAYFCTNAETVFVESQRKVVCPQGPRFRPQSPFERRLLLTNVGCARKR